MLSRLFLATSLFLCPLIIALENHLGPLDESGLTIEAPLKRPVLGLKLAGLSFPLSGLDADSNAFFVQGISALHAFWNFEAERNFREVIRRNPKHPLPRAFAAFAQKVFSSGDAVRGAEYIRSAHSQLLAGGSVISEVEHLWLEAIQALYDTRLENDKARQAAHISLLRQVLKSAREPGLIRETKAFLALALWNYKIVGAPRDQPEIVILREEADRLIEEVLKEIPCHPVHHYKIHLWNGTHDILARDSAKICGMCNADAQHLWHMPSHIFSNVKEFRNAAYNFEAGLRVDNRHLNTAALPSHVIHNYSHNIDYLMSVSTANGAIDRALIIAKNALAGPRFFQGQEYHDPVDRTAEALVNLLENHFMWKEGIDLYQGGFLSGLLDRKGDGVRKAKLLRFIGLAALETREWNLAHKMIDEIRSVRDIVSKQEGNTAPSLVELEKLETDLRFWRNVRESSETHSIPENTLQELQKLGVTPLHRLALLSEEDGNSMGALASAKEAVQKEGASDVMPRAILAYLLAKNDQKVEALRQWNVI